MTSTTDGRKTRAAWIAGLDDRALDAAKWQAWDRLAFVLNERGDVPEAVIQWARADLDALNVEIGRRGLRA